MIDKKKLYESLDAFIDSVAASDDDVEKVSIKEYINTKAKAILEFNGDSKIKLDGNRVVIDGHRKGTVQHDPNDMNHGIVFTDNRGNIREEFDTLEELYSFLVQTYKVDEGSIELVEAEEELEEGRVEDAVSKQDAMRSERMKRWTGVRNKKQPDGKAGDYDSGDESEYTDKIKGGPDAAFSGHELDKRHKKGYYDSKDPRKKHKDPVRGGSEPAHPGGASDIETDGGYDSHDVRKEHNK